MTRNKLKIEYIIWSALVLGLFLIFVSFLKQLNFPDTTYNLEKGKRVEIVPGDTLQQKFTASEDGLNNLKILLGGRPLKEKYNLDLILADANCKNELQRKRLNGPQQFNSKYLYNFKFDRVNNSRDKNYCLVMKYTTNVKNPKKREVRLFENDFEHQGGLDRRGEQADQGVQGIGGGKGINGYVVKKENGDVKIQSAKPIVFRQSFRNNNILQDFQQLNQRMSQYKPWFLKGHYLSIIIIMSILLTTMSLLALIGKNKK